MNEHRLIGAHEVWLEGDLLGIRYNGVISKAEMLDIVDFIDTAADRLHNIYVLIDSNNTSLPSVEVRRVMAERGYARVSGMVRYQRAASSNAWLTILLQNAARLIGRLSTRTQVVETESEARAWIDALRQQHSTC